MTDPGRDECYTALGQSAHVQITSTHLGTGESLGRQKLRVNQAAFELHCPHWPVAARPLVSGVPPP